METEGQKKITIMIEFSALGNHSQTELKPEILKKLKVDRGCYEHQRHVNGAKKGKDGKHKKKARKYEREFS